VTNGYATPEHMDVMKGLLDAYRVDIKAFTEDFYRKTCKAKLQPVLESTKIAKDYGMHVEVVTLLIPGLNDKEDEIRGLSKWIIDNLGPEVPVHFTRFYPMYNMDHEAPTPIATLEKAYDIARKDDRLRIPGQRARPPAREHLVSAVQRVVDRALRVQDLALLYY
jgi:pyruvate formate lyase activating enzyme